MDKSKFFTATVLVAALSVPTISHSALIGRLAATEGGTDYQAYYDDVLGMTWSTPFQSVPADGLEWADNFSLGGIENWFLAGVDELSHMYDVNGIRSNEPNIFSGSSTCWGRANLQACLPNEGRFYTSDTYAILDPYGNPSETPLRFSFQAGGTSIFGSDFAGWAITNGDVFASVVPVPASLWLFGSGLIGLVGFARKNYV